MHSFRHKKPAIKQVFYLIDPFEVREVLQARCIGEWYGMGLNPFEVREVLQAQRLEPKCYELVSIPLKSGRCCKKPLSR